LSTAVKAKPWNACMTLLLVKNNKHLHGRLFTGAHGLQFCIYAESFLRARKPTQKHRMFNKTYQFHNKSCYSLMWWAVVLTVSVLRHHFLMPCSE
jgi:hypothetical protein